MQNRLLNSLFSLPNDTKSTHIKKTLVTFIDSESCALTLPQLNHFFRTMLAEDSFAKLHHAAKNRVIVFKGTLKPSGLFPNTSTDHFDYQHLSGGYTNSTYKVGSPNNGFFIARIPGKGSDSFINRAAEHHNAKIATQLKLNPDIKYNDGKLGYQLIVCLDKPKPLTPEIIVNEPQYLAKIASMQKTLHTSEKRFANEENIFHRNQGFQQLIADSKIDLTAEYTPIQAMVQKIHGLVASLNIPSVPCHNDPYYNNFLISNDDVYLIDWEYSGNHDPIWDVAYFAKLARLSPQQIHQYLSAYFETPNYKTTRELDYQRFIVYQLIVDDFVYLWAYAQIANKNESVEEKDFIVWASDALKSAKGILENSEFIEAVEKIENYLVIRTLSNR